MKYQSNKKAALEALKQAEERTLEAIGVFVVGEAVVRTPVDTGNLRGSINHRVDADGKSVAIGTNVEYAVFQELGTRRMQVQPFLTPAVEDNVDKIKKIASEMMRID